MPLTAGMHLGRYEIRSLIGAGGMGEVYLEKDAQLGRMVALKMVALKIFPPRRIIQVVAALCFVLAR